MADFLVALAEFDRQRLWVQLGHASVFYYLHRELGLSKGAAHYRKVAAHLIQRFPEVVEPLRAGKALHHQRGGVGPGPHAGEQRRRPAEVLPPVEAGGQGCRGGDLPGGRDPEAGAGDGVASRRTGSTG